MSAADSVAQAESANNQPIADSNSIGQTIQLLDHTKTEDAPPEAQGPGNASTQGSTQVSNRPSVERDLSRRWTKSSLQHSRTQRKYARYQEDTFVEQAVPEGETVIPPKGRRQRGKTMVKDFIHGKKIKQAQEEDAIIEILYENQRGFFTFGIPHFSSKSLLNFDPKAWTNAKQRGSPVNITNAQVPDPNWEWAWKSWYVDMSRDVDEDGWEYSLLFYGTAWHGNHPWFHSFVRRRRWLRKRVRKHPHHARGRTPGQKHMSEAHMLTPEYFTIHPTKSRSADDGTGAGAGSIATSGSLTRPSFDSSSKDEAEKNAVSDIATLLLLLRRATIDREKIVLIRSFLRNAADELFYLAQEMPHIMSLLMFQNSRRDLLRLLMDALADASQHRAMHEKEEKDEGEAEKTRIDNLLHATEAADREVKKLQYWSDIRTMVRDGKTAAAVDGEGWDAEKWQGVEGTGPMANEESGAKEPGRSSEEVRRDADLLERTASRSTTGTEQEVGKRGAVHDAGREEVERRDEEEEDDDEEGLPRVGPSNDEQRTAEQKAIPLEEYDKGVGNA